MLERIFFMMDNNYIHYDKNFIEAYKSIVHNSKLCKLLNLKLEITRSRETFQKVIDLIEQIKVQDIELMNLLYKMINKEVMNKDKQYIYSRSGYWFDVAYNLKMNLANSFEIKFKLHIINNKSKGYIRISNQELLNRYCEP
ncbi:hypothetical protein, partial [Anaerosporobacter sp.]